MRRSGRRQLPDERLLRRRGRVPELSRRAPSAAPTSAPPAPRRPGGRATAKGPASPGGLSACTPYVCGTTVTARPAARTTADCAAGFVCNGTICGKKVNGTTCTAATECGSGYCEQGVCCNTGCEATCQSCNLSAATAGTCTNVPVGDRPAQPVHGRRRHHAAAPTAPATARGSASSTRAEPSACAQSCAVSTLTASSRCDGAGKCVAGTTRPVRPTSAAGRLPRAPAAANTDCTSPNVCTAMSCGKYPIGSACSANTDCNSSFCAQGDCCNTACTGTCQSCALTEQHRDLHQRAVGPGPARAVHGRRLHQLRQQRLLQRCRRLPEVRGGDAVRTGDLHRLDLRAGIGLQRHRDVHAGDRHLVRRLRLRHDDQIARSPAPWTPTARRPTSATPAPARSRRSATPAPPPATCASGLCQQGVCCASTCSGTCASCALTGTLGTCTNIPAGTDPLNACTDATAATCGTDGTCDGSGKCRLYAAGTVCAAQSCTGATFTPARSLRRHRCLQDGQLVALRAVRLRHDEQHLQDELRGHHRLRLAEHLQHDDERAAACCRRAPPARPTTSASPPPRTASRASAARRPAPPTARLAPSPGRSAPASPSPRARTRSTSAPTRRRPPAGPTASATAAAPVRSTPAARRASRRAARRRRITRPRPATPRGTCVTPATSSCTPFICGTNACKTTCTADADCISAAYMCAGGSCIQAVNITVQLTNAGRRRSRSGVYFDIRVTNNGTTADAAVAAHHSLLVHVGRRRDA